MNESHNTQEFVKLWTAESRRVYAYILSLHPNTADADELLQETALTVWQKFDSFEPGTNFRAWACQIARNKVGSFWQLRRHTSIHFGDDLVDRIDGLIAVKSDVLDAQFEALADCNKRLSHRDQRLIELRYHGGGSVVTVARKVNRSMDAIYKALRRIRSVLLDCVSAAVSDTDNPTVDGPAT